MSEMVLDLQGMGMYRLKEVNYKRFMEILDISDELLLDLIEMKNSCNVCPRLSINVEKIEHEGLVDYGHITTQIGAYRINKLLNEKVLTK